MAEKNTAPSVEELQAKLAEAEAKAAAAEKAMQAAKSTGVVSPLVPGTFTVSGTDGDGKSGKKKFRFKNGRIRTPLPNGLQVPSAALIKLANGTAAEKIEGLERFPWFYQLDQEAAQAVLDRLVEINSSTIEPA